MKTVLHVRWVETANQAVNDRRHSELIGARWKRGAGYPLRFPDIVLCMVLVTHLRAYKRVTVDVLLHLCVEGVRLAHTLQNLLLPFYACLGSPPNYDTGKTNTLRCETSRGMQSIRKRLPILPSEAAHP